MRPSARTTPSSGWSLSRRPLRPIPRARPVVSLRDRGLLVERAAPTTGDEVGRTSLAASVAVKASPMF